MGATLEPELADRIAAQIAVAPVLDLDGRESLLRDYFRYAPTVLSFVRHFGCLFCHQMVHDLIVTVPRIVALGARVVIVGNGNVEQARHFFKAKNLPSANVDVLTDPARTTFRAAELERGYVRTFVNRAAHRAFGRARAQGHTITGLFGDLTQLGGLLVMKPPVSLVYLHRSQFAGDHPDMDEVVAAVGYAMT
jgi:peroxiredoxin